MLSSLNPTLMAIPTLILLIPFARAYGRASGLVIQVPGHTLFTLIYAQPTCIQTSLNKTFWPRFLMATPLALSPSPRLNILVSPPWV